MADPMVYVTYKNGQTFAQVIEPVKSTSRFRVYPVQGLGVTAKIQNMDNSVNRFGRPIKKVKRQGKKPGRDYPRNKSGHRSNPYKKN